MTSYERKTRDEYDILGDYGYGHGPEVLTTEDTLREASHRLKEYRDNDRLVANLRIRKRRVKK